MEKNKTSIKISEEGLSFLRKLITNRRKADVDESDLAYWKVLDVIAKYFKSNNDKYLELVKTQWSKNV